MLCAEHAIKLDITKNVVGSQGTFQGKALKRHMSLRKLPLPTRYFNEAGQGLSVAEMNMLSSKVNPSKALIIEFGCGMKATSIDSETSTQT